MSVGTGSLPSSQRGLLPRWVKLADGVGAGGGSVADLERAATRASS